MINYSIIKKCLSVRLFCLLLLMFSATIVFSQKRTISGNVVDEIKEPLIGVTVQVKGTTQGTVTDLDGNYSILVVSENLPLFGCSTTYKPITYKILFRETNPRRDKNGTEPQENEIKNALLRISVSEYLLLRCKGTNLSRQKRIKTHKVHIYSAFFIFLYHGR